MSNSVATFAIFFLIGSSLFIDVTGRSNRARKRSRGGLYYHIFHSPRKDFSPGNTNISVCHKTPLILRGQRKLCKQHFNLMESIFSGYALGLTECEHQFKKQRWNCTGHKVLIKSKRSPKTYTDRLVNRGMRESAYVLSVTSAGVVYQITKACSRGTHHLCGCDKSAEQQKNFTWAGCSDNVFFGMAFAQKFMDIRESKRKKNKKLMMINQHNNHVGRESVEGVMETKCKCHGVSGSCEMKTCWRTLPSFRTFGKYLQRRYKDIVHAEVANNWLIARTHNRRIDRDRDLVFLVDSPRHIFCGEDPRSGSLGTQGRRCNATGSSWNTFSCSNLCCGRGYASATYEVKENCHCRFHWCCEVVCETCRRHVEESTCN